MAKKPTNAIQMLSEWLVEEWERNYREKGYKGLGIVYGGHWEVCKKYSGISNPQLLLDELNKELEKRGFKIVGDKRAKLKLVKMSEEDRVKREVENRFEEFMKKYR